MHLLKWEAIVKRSEISASAEFVSDVCRLVPFGSDDGVVDQASKRNGCNPRAPERGTDRTWVRRRRGHQGRRCQL